MHTLRTVIAAVWIVFWVYWLAAALTAKRSAPRGRRRWLRLNGVGVIGVVLLLRIFRGGNATIHSPVLGAIGAVLIAAGLGVAIWARIVIGRNWGMPMTQKQEPELVTGGPYATVRHPIYSGLLFAIAGTALATSLWALVIAAIVAAIFTYAASVEERNLAATFPTTYPGYRDSTKMLIPFVL